MTARALIFAAFALTAPAAQAVTLEFPVAATQSAEVIAPMSDYALPLGPWKDGHIETLPAEGTVIKQAWQLQDDQLTTLQILKPLREQLASAGYETLFECKSDGCGGFDFRYANKIIPEPAMHVDLGDFRVLTARRDEDGDPEYIGLLVSRSATRGFVQVVQVGSASDIPVPVVASTKTPAVNDPVITAGDLTTRLETRGRAVLRDVEFATGTSQLGDGDFASLSILADYLNSHPDRRIMLVGHTDSVGDLDRNIALSKKRATSVAEYLIGALGVAPEQVSAEGVGYLAPMASNLTDDGREKNRRVEVILTSTQ